MPERPERVDDQTKNVIIDLRINGHKTMRQIHDETGVSLGKVAEITKGIKINEGPPEEKAVEKPAPTQFIPQLINRELQSKLYALGLNEDYDDVNKFIDEIVMPWLSVLRDFEWKLRQKVKPREFAFYIEGCMIDSLELKELKGKLGQLSTQPEPALANVHVDQKPKVNAS